MTELLHKDLTGRIIGVYYTVYNRLSQTYPEFIYEQAMHALLERLGIRCIRQDEYEIRYKGQLVGVQRLDIFVASEVVVELKVADTIEPIHLAQLLSYLKTISRPVPHAAGGATADEKAPPQSPPVAQTPQGGACPVLPSGGRASVPPSPASLRSGGGAGGGGLFQASCLLFRFGGPEPEFARRILTPQAWHETLNPDPATLAEQADLLYPELTHEIIGSVLGAI